MATFLDPKGRRTPYGEFPTVSVDRGWPAAGLIARANDARGAAILSYLAKWKNHPNFPKSFWDDRRGEIYLPDLDQPRSDTDPVPLYRLREFGAVGASVYAAGSEISYTGWPKNPSLLKPMNTSASLVLDYMARVAPGRTLPGMPHENGVLRLPSPALDAVPQNYTHRGTFGSAA